MLHIGIDLGTSAVKLLLVDEKGTILRTESESYPIAFPNSGWSEQNPEDWKRACFCGIRKLLEGIDTSQVVGIAAGGQMHGLVVLDEADRVIRPAILWNDGRTFAEVDYLNENIGREQISSYTGNIAFAGFTAPKLLWMQKNEPEAFRRIRRIMLPKDYINYCLTGAHCTDYSDASGMLLLDVKNKCWSPEMLELCGLKTDQMPVLHESWDVIGTLKPEIAAELGLSENVRVAAGAGDNAAAAIGTGTVEDGDCNLSIGTSGTILIASDHFHVDSQNGLHAFSHASGRFLVMGCMLSAASANQWFCSEILGTTDYAFEQSFIPMEKLGENSVYFLPYLMGERSPINDTNARGVFIGMSMNTSRAEMLQAVLEGVAYAIRDSLEVARGLGLTIPRSKICGGGSKSPLWQKIFANVLGIPLEIVKTEQGPGMGAAMISMVACGEYPDIQTVCHSLVEVVSTIQPEPELTAKYEAQYQKFRTIYPACHNIFPLLTA